MSAVAHQCRECGQPTGRLATQVAIYYMRDNHTFLRLSGSPAEMVAQATAEWEAEGGYGMLCAPILLDARERELRRLTLCVHGHGVKRRDEWEADCRRWIQEVEGDEDVTRLLASGPPLGDLRAPNGGTDG